MLTLQRISFPGNVPKTIYKITTTIFIWWSVSLRGWDDVSTRWQRVRGWEAEYRLTCSCHGESKMSLNNLKSVFFLIKIIIRPGKQWASSVIDTAELKSKHEREYCDCSADMMFSILVYSPKELGTEPRRLDCRIFLDVIYHAFNIKRTIFNLDTKKLVEYLRYFQKSTTFLCSCQPPGRRSGHKRSFQVSNQIAQRIFENELARFLLNAPVNNTYAQICLRRSFASITCKWVAIYNNYL